MARKPKAEAEFLRWQITEQLLAGVSGRQIAADLHTTRSTVRQVKHSLAEFDAQVAELERTLPKANTMPAPMVSVPVLLPPIEPRTYVINDRVRLNGRDWVVKWVYADGFLRLMSVFGAQPRDRVDPAHVSPAT